MLCILCIWSFSEGESFNETQQRYMHNLLAYLPDGTKSVHIVCDRYEKSPSLKSREREYRSRGKPQKVYDIQGHLPTPVWRDFICSKENKSSLLRYLCESWSSKCNSDLQLILGGGFSDITKTVCIMGRLYQ